LHSPQADETIKLVSAGRDTINGVSMDLFEHPGFMNYDGLFEILHADWPVYPPGHGWQLALAGLAVFPDHVSFQQIDEIDKCVLFVARNVGRPFEPGSNPHDFHYFHVAVWEEDLLELHRRGAIRGISLISEYEAAMSLYEQRSTWLVRSEKGTRQLNLPKPEREDYEDFLGNPTSKLQVASRGISVTPEGSEALRRLAPPVDQLPRLIGDRVKPLLAISYHDTAVRDASIILESQLREVNGSSSFGQMLVNEYYEFLCARNNGRPTALFKVLRGELRTIFKFVRNDYAHALHDITESQCCMLLDRISQALNVVTHIEEVERRD
jgi:hypothetical protein